MDKYYEKGEKYWRGSIWININYLILRGVYLYYRNNKNAMEMYGTLKNNIINNIFRNWKDTGYFYEHYSCETGAGLGAFPFNGWTSLINLINDDIY